MNACDKHIEHLHDGGEISFTSRNLAAAVGWSVDAVRDRLRVLMEEGRVANPIDDFHVIVPDRYRLWRCLPASKFAHKMMAYLDEPYYVALMSAGVYHGAAHQSPMVLQLMVPKARPSVVCEGKAVDFIEREDMRDTPILKPDEYGDILRVASAEATALEVVGYYKWAGYFNNVATILIELFRNIEIEALKAEARRAPVHWVQRLGYLLDFVGWREFTGPIEDVLSERDFSMIPLAPWRNWDGVHIDERWKIAVNKKVDPDL